VRTPTAIRVHTLAWGDGAAAALDRALAAQQAAAADAVTRAARTEARMRARRTAGNTAALVLNAAWTHAPAVLAAGAVALALPAIGARPARMLVAVCTALAFLALAAYWAYARAYFPSLQQGEGGGEEKSGDSSDDSFAQTCAGTGVLMASMFYFAAVLMGQANVIPMAWATWTVVLFGMALTVWLRSRRAAGVLRVVLAAPPLADDARANTWGSAIVDSGLSCDSAGAEIVGQGGRALVAGRLRVDADGTRALASTGRRSLYAFHYKGDDPRAEARRLLNRRRLALVCLIGVPLIVLALWLAFAGQLPPYDWPEGD
jgi:hypothetical protein